MSEEKAVINSQDKLFESFFKARPNSLKRSRVAARKPEDDSDDLQSTDPLVQDFHKYIRKLE